MEPEIARKLDRAFAPRGAVSFADPMLWNSSIAGGLLSRLGKYVKSVIQERELREMTQQLLRNSIGLFDKFNHIRKNQSLAHDNVFLEKAEARFIFDSISAVLRFGKSIDASRLES
jgi:hypothetical protein